LGKSKTRLYDSSLLKKQTVWKSFLHTNVGTFSADFNKSARKYGCNFRSATPTLDLPWRGVRCSTRWFAPFFLFGSIWDETSWFTPIQANSSGNESQNGRYGPILVKTD